MRRTRSLADVTDERLREAAGQLAAEARLFGSEAGPDRACAEDHDIGVLAPHAVDAVALTNRLITLLGVQAVDLADLRRADPLLLALVATRWRGARRARARRIRSLRGHGQSRDGERQAIRELARQRMGAP